MSKQTFLRRSKWSGSTKRLAALILAGGKKRKGTRRIRRLRRLEAAGRGFDS
jgi:hypothetical protein